MTEIAAACRKLGLTLNDGQTAALHEALSAITAGRTHLITGYAGSGKTTLVQVLAVILLERKIKVALTAPTHKAVAVLGRKFKAMGIEGIGLATIHKLLSLTAKPVGDRLVFQRRKDAEPVEADVVVIDECSMVQADLTDLIDIHLAGRSVLYVGDPAQLPPVGEIESVTFSTSSRSHLDTIVRQGAGNPLLDAAHAIREQQGGEMDWSWARAARADNTGVFLPGDRADVWLKRAFQSQAFADDPDTHRCLAWTNDRVGDLNSKVRRWLYGEDIPTPFMPGERGMFRAPLMMAGNIVVNTNEEVKVLAIEQGEKAYSFEASRTVEGWTAVIPSWRMMLRTDDGLEFEAHMVRGGVRPVEAALARCSAEAKRLPRRWAAFHDFKASFARMQSIYAMTVHTSQGSTFRNVFMDIGDIRRRVQSNPLEAQQLLYVGATRPSHTLTLLGV